MTSVVSIHTIGHSTRSADEFLRLLNVHGMTQVADIRTVPRSRRHPQFNQDQLESWLTANAIAYRHFGALGGLRKPRSDSINTAWRHAGFRGYADHMQTDEFRDAVDALLEFGAAGPTCVMCAEAVWWECHRRLLSDSLLVRGVPVRHILTDAEPKPHERSEFAREVGGQLTYPGLL
ncbi:MAG: DUF488 domain-containing protein [Acidobacteria bacterium]|nr:DUF488 domain-containing protein [Acidobacteriota bacterium]MCA1650446.1 DUF488 domain-containing protein [Acidobacteriota bacterium]